MTPARLSISGSDFAADRSVDFIKAVRGCVAQSARNLCDAERHGIIKCCQKSSPKFECMPGWGYRALSSDGNRLLCGGYVRGRRSQRSIEARNRNIQVSSDSQQIPEPSLGHRVLVGEKDARREPSRVRFFALLRQK